jgi:hypothetical protein
MRTQILDKISGGEWNHIYIRVPVNVEHLFLRVVTYFKQLAQPSTQENHDVSQLTD